MRGYYLHIPFCEKKCSYCDFYSLETTQHIDTFVETLLREQASLPAMLHLRYGYGREMRVPIP